MAHAFSSRPMFDGVEDHLFDFGTGKDLNYRYVDAISRFARELQHQTQVGETLWSVYARQCHDEFQILAEGNLARVNDLVRKLYATPLTHGFLQGHVASSGLLESAASRKHVGSIILDRFFRLAEAVGAVRVLSPEHGQNVIRIGDLDGIMARIEDEIGADLPAPEQDGGLFGLRLRGGIYSDRHFDGIYAAWRARELARADGIETPSVCEIGGGAGHLTYYMRKLGSRCCAIIDLPQALTVQYLMLVTDFNDNRVSLEHPLRDGIELIRAGTADAEDMRRWHVVINVDSMPEMPPSAAEQYINGITKGQTFVSINQESAVENGEHRQNIVRDMASRAQLKRSSRYPAWLRNGYVEEVYTRRA